MVLGLLFLLHFTSLCRDGNCIISNRKSLQYHSSRQHWTTIPEHTGSWNWKSHNDGKLPMGEVERVANKSCIPSVQWVDCSASSDAVREERQILHEWQRSRDQRYQWQGKVEKQDRTMRNICYTMWFGFILFILVYCPLFIQVTEVVLKSAHVIPADVLIVGIGEWNNMHHPKLDCFLNVIVLHSNVHVISLNKHVVSKAMTP